MQLLQILYTESDTMLASQILEHFNPPTGMPLELLEKRNKHLPEKDKYKYNFHFCSNFTETLNKLVLHNFDPLGREIGLKPFDTVFLEVRRKSKLDRYSWSDFLHCLSSIGLERLQLTRGLIAHGPEIDLETREILANHGVRYYLPKPFPLDKLRLTLKNYEFYSAGSHYIKIEEREKSEDSAIKRRVLRFYNFDGKLEALELSAAYPSQSPILFG
jgi:hypothetical protein